MAEKLNITLEPIFLPNKFPLVKIANQIVELKTSTTIDIDIYNGNNQFDIEFLNKISSDTKVVDGKIVDDLAVIIKKIDYNNFDFLPYIDIIGTYTTYNNKLITQTHGFMAFAGIFKFNIRGPLFILSRDLAIINGQR